MAYTSYETADGEALAQVGSICRHSARLDGTFAPDGIPRLSDVQRFITQSHYWVQGQLSRNGIDLVQTNQAVVNFLQDLVTTDAAIRIELSLPASDESGAPTARFEELRRRRDELVAMINDGTLVAMGADSDAEIARNPIVTGQSISRKQVLESDPDQTQHRVRRNIFTRDSALGTAESS